MKLLIVRRIGSLFPPGINTVTCTATDPSGNQASSSFRVTVLNAGLEDQNTGCILQWSTTTGDYLFTKCGPTGFTVSGKGTTSVTNGVQILMDTRTDRRTTAMYLGNQMNGRATIMLAPAPGVFQTYSIVQTLPRSTFVCSS